MQDGTFLKITFWIFISITSLIIITLPPQSEQIQEKPKNVGITISHIYDSQKCEINGNKTNQMVNNQSMTNNIPNGMYTKSYNWGWSDDYCLRNIKLKDGSIIRIPRCEF